MLEYLIDDSYVCESDTVAVGVSGGADSMLLLWALMDKQKKVGFKLHVINVNHGIRGEESDADSEFVKNFCVKKKIPYTIASVDAKAFKESEKVTLEESARKLRYDAFFDVMKKEKLNKLFLAHNKSDQAETILMHIFRGSGISGACGMRSRENIYRPLINLEKSEIYNLANEHGIKFVEDSTNKDNKYARNFVRNEIIAKAEKMYPSLVEMIARFGERCTEVYDYIIKSLNLGLVEINDESVLIKSEAFDNPNFLCCEYIKFALGKLGEFADFEEKHLQKIIELARGEVNKTIDLPHKLQAKSTYSGVKIVKQTKTVNQDSESAQFAIGKFETKKYIIKTSFVSAFDIEYGDGNLYADYSKIAANAVWRFREPGDVFSKLGTGSKKLNDYFTDKKIEFDLRDSIPVLASGSQILIVAGFDVSEKVKVDGDTDQIVKFEFTKK